ncbi:MAG: hypothetical protein FWE22_02360 [Firmicutes bacterium]|nr:hypothetical protein [Bacillota bacterium]
MIFAELFIDMSIITIFSIVAGLILIIIHMQSVSSKRRELALIGVLLIIGGMTLRLIMSFSFAVLFAMTFFVTVVLLGADIIILFIQKRAWLTVSLSHAIMQREKDASEYDFLKDLTALAVTDIKESGQINLNGTVYEVYSENFIENGSFVKIVNCEKNKIFVKKIEEDFFRREED